MALIFTPIPFLVINLPNFRNSGTITPIGWILSCFAIGYLLCFSVLLFRLRWLLGFFNIIANLLGRINVVSYHNVNILKRKFFKEAVRFSRSLKIYARGKRQDVLLSFLFTAIFLLSLFLFPSLLFWGAGYKMDFFLTTGLLTISTCLMYFAPSPGGAGVAEGIFGLFFAAGINNSEFIGIMLIWRFLTIYLGMIIGVPVTMHEMHLARGER